VKSKKPKVLIPSRGRPKLSDGRKASHIPLNDAERAKLHGVASTMGMPYATWARATLLIVADWPLDSQPLRRAAMSAPSTVSPMPNALAPLDSQEIP